MNAKYIVPALLFTCVFAASAHAADSFTGEWVAAVEQNRSFTCTFTQKGKVLSGTCSSPAASGQSVVGAASGTVNGKNVTWTLVLQRDTTSQTREYTGQWDLKNTANMQWTMKSASVNGTPMIGPALAPKPVVFTRTPAK